MWMQNLKIAFRGIARDKSYSLLNIVGLAIALTCSFLFLFWIKFELSYERSYPNSERIYRLMDFQERAAGPYYSLQLPYPVAELKDRYPQIEGVALYTSLGTQSIREFGKTEGETLRADMAFSSADFLPMFGYQYLEGALPAADNRQGVILGEELARKLFGTESAVGKSVSPPGSDTPLPVEAVVRIPENTELRFDILLPRQIDITSGAGQQAFILLREGVEMTPELSAELAQYAASMPRRGQTYFHEGTSELVAQPLRRIHLHSPAGLMTNQNVIYIPKGDRNQLYIFSVVALLILLIAIINYINTSIARSMSRMKEVGVRKVNGALKRQLAGRFLSESLVVTLIAVVLSMALVKGVFPDFTKIMGNTIPLHFDGSTIAVAAAVCGLVAVLSGGYAAFYLSRLSPLTVLRGGTTTGSKEGLRKVLLGVQFFLAVGILVCTAIIYKQIHSILNNRNGMNREHVLYMSVDNPRNLPSFAEAVMAENPDILSATVAHAPPYRIARSYTGVTWSGSPEETKTMEFGQVYSDHRYAEVFGLEILEGEFLPPGQGRTAQQIMDEQGYREVVVNETFARLMGQEHPVGLMIRNEGGPAKIIGMVKDFNFKPLKETIQPLMLSYEPNAMFTLYVKTTGRHDVATMEYLRSKYGRMYSPAGDPAEFPAGTVEEEFSGMHSSELRTGSIMRILSAIALFLSLLGVIGMVSFMLERRTREITLRKVHGASAGDIIGLFARGILRVAAFAALAAIPLCYVIMSRWLAVYVFRTGLSWWIFSGISAAILLLTFGVIAVQVYDTARRNPAKSLQKK